MGKVYKLRDAINLIWETVKITEEQGVIAECPYLFIVGAGISVPEIVPASGIVQHCQDKVKELYGDNEEEMKSVFDKTATLTVNSAEYYSYWFEQAYKNKIHRQQYLKSIISKARISTSNLLLAQVLNSRKIATTVITPNFDNQLLKSLNLLGNYNVFSANNVLDNIALTKNSNEIQIMHVHGTYQFYDCCNLKNEIIKIANGQGIKSTAGTIEEFLKSQSPIVIGYSGWEDDVIMSKIRERLEYAVLPYKLLWFCFSNKDYESLPCWLKDSEDAIFVLPDSNESSEANVDNMEEPLFLPAEDVLSALITKFGFNAPNLFSNPIKYYIELIDGFLPENGDIFPIKAWKHRLDFIEEHLGDIEKEIIALDDAAARKDVIDVTKILREMDYNYISDDDLEHVINGVILPLLNNKNRIEDKRDLLEFLNVILDLFIRKYGNIETVKLEKCLERIIYFFSNYSKIENEEIVKIYNKILEICRLNKYLEEIELTVLGMKSDIVDEKQKIDLQNEIIERGTEKIENFKIARLIMVAVFRQIRDKKILTKQQKEIINKVIEKHEGNKKILELYFNELINFYNEKIKIDLEIEELIDKIIEKELSKGLLLHARLAQCEAEDNNKNKINIACEAIEEFDYDDIDNCRDCLDYAWLLAHIVVEKINEEENIERKYIDYILQLCSKDEGCNIVSKIMLAPLCNYIESIQSQFEKRELCKKAIDICNRCKLYEDWSCFSDMYVDYLEKKEREAYISDNEQYRIYREANEKVSIAIQSYVNHDIDTCGKLLIEVSEVYDKIFEEKYNPALVNICFMARRNELSGLDISVFDLLNKITWDEGSAFLNINKALAYILQNDWVSARKEIAEIEYDLDSALEWWSQKEVVGREEMFTVLLLLALEDKLAENNELVKTEEFWSFCKESISIPNDIKNELNDIRTKYEGIKNT